MLKQGTFKVVAYISKLYGSNGEVIIKLNNFFPSEIDLKEPLFVEIDKLMVPFYISSFTTRGENKAIVTFVDLDNELRISEFIGLELNMRNSALDIENDDEELFFDDLVGYKLFDLYTHKTGLITNYLDYKNNPIFVVDFEGIEVMVPASEEIVGDIYVDAEVVEAQVPEGLYDFYQEQNK